MVCGAEHFVKFPKKPRQDSNRIISSKPTWHREGGLSAYEYAYQPPDTYTDSQKSSKQATRVLQTP